MSAPNRKITPVQLFSVLFLSRLFAAMTYIAGLDRDLQPGETVVAMLYASALIVIAGVGEAVFLKNDSGVGILMRTKNASKKLFVFTDVFYLVFFLAYSALAAARFNLFVFFKNTAAAASRFDVLNFRGVRPGKGFEMFETGFMSAARTAEIASIPILTPFLNSNPTKPMFRWIGVTLVSLVLISSMISGVLGQFGYEQIFPMYSLTVLAEFGILERLDAIVTAVWVLCFIDSYLLKELTPIERKYSPFACAVPVGIGAMLMSKNIDILADVIKSGFLTVLFIGGGIVIPITVVIIEKIRKNKNKAETVQ